MPVFTEDDILNAQTDSPMETSLVPVPEGEFPAYIRDVKARTGTSQDGNPWSALDVIWEITDPAVAEETGLSNPTVRQTIFLDIDENGGLAVGKNKNVQLGRLREAVGQNGPGPWSPSNLVGASGVVRVEHREYNGKVFADVRGVAAA